MRRLLALSLVPGRVSAVALVAQRPASGQEDVPPELARRGRYTVKIAG